MVCKMLAAKGLRYFDEALRISSHSARKSIDTLLFGGYKYFRRD